MRPTNDLVISMLLTGVQFFSALAIYWFSFHVLKSGFLGSSLFVIWLIAIWPGVVMEYFGIVPVAELMTIFHPVLFIFMCAAPTGLFSIAVITLSNRLLANEAKASSRG